MLPARASGLLVILVSIVPVWAQNQNDASLTGDYFIRQVLFEPAPGGGIADGAGLVGTATFDGNGGFTFNGQRAAMDGTTSPDGGVGTYSVSANGALTLTNPLRPAETVNARLGDGIVLGSTTDGSTEINDLLIGVPVPAAAVDNSALTGSWWAAHLDFPAGSVDFARNTFFRFEADGAGAIADISIIGRAMNVGDRPVTQTISGATYDLNPNGSGTLRFPFPAGADPNLRLLGGDKALMLAAGGNLLVAGSGLDMLIAVRAPAAAAPSDLAGLYFAAGLRLAAREVRSFSGSANSNGAGTMLWSRRIRHSAGVLDFTGVNAYAIQPDGSGTAALSRIAIGEGGFGVMASGVSVTAPDNMELYFCLRAPQPAGEGVFLHPNGIVNAASFAPVGNSISPGEFITLFGTGLAPGNAVAAAPFPTVLNAVQVLINDIPAPVYAVSATQLSVLVPHAVTGGIASIMVDNNGQQSNVVEVPVAPTSPGIFTVPPAGVGAGAILKADFSLVGPANRARRGDVVQVFLTGLGGVQPPVPDGEVAPVNPLSVVTAPVTVYVGGLVAAVSFQGLAPRLAGLYQLNITIPLDAPTGNAIPLAIETPDAFHDQVDIAIGP